MSSKNKTCAPSKTANAACFTLQQLQAIAREYNNHPATVKKVSIMDDYTQLLHQLRDRLQHRCSDELCWLTTPYIESIKDASLKQDILTNTFKPKGPKGKFTWLNTINIDEVMRQYEKVHTDFTYLGALPVDFAELPWLNLTRSATGQLLQDLHKRSKHKIGVIFNLDEHNKPGSHWVGLYANLKDGHVFYFDSYGKPPERRIEAFMDQVNRFVQSKGIESKVLHNRLRHQYSNSECGLYSLNFVLKMVEARDKAAAEHLFIRFNNERVEDKLVTRLRGRLFRPPN